MPIRKFNRAGILYARGTVRLGKKSRRIYETTGIRSNAPGAGDLFHAWRVQREKEILDELLFGPQLTTTWTEAAARRLERRQQERLTKRPDLAGQADPEAWMVLRMTDFFRTRGVADKPLRQIAQTDIEAYFAEVHAGHALSTKMRALASYQTVMNDAKKRGEIETVPLPSTLPEDFDTLGQPVEKMLFSEEVLLLVGHAATHFSPLVATLFGTGRRSGELPFLSRTKNLRWETGNERLFLGFTKNGKPIYVRLPQFAVDALNASLAARRDAHDALFLTDKGRPYKRPRRQRGGLLDTAFKAMRRRVAIVLALAVRELRTGHPDSRLGAEARELVNRLLTHTPAGQIPAAFLVERLKVMRRVTPHWGRHNAASHLFDKGADESDVMDHLGWRDRRSAARYRWRSKRHGQRMADKLDFVADVESAEPVQPPAPAAKTA